jgi:hypothetical protein
MFEVFMKLLNKVNSTYTSTCQKIGALLESSSKVRAQLALFAFGAILLSAALGLDAEADRQIRYNDKRVVEATNGVLLYLEGSFGALVMVSAGIGAILSSAFGQYRAALGLMVVAIGSFILRSLMSTFFNDQNIAQ